VNTQPPEAAGPVPVNGLVGVLPGALTALGMPGLPDPLGLGEALAGVRRVAVLLVDGMGWHQLAAMSPMMRELPSYPVSCGFPSTTPVSLTSLATGALPGAHGILAFTTLVPGTQKILNHVLWTDNPDPLEWQPVPPLYVSAAAHGIDVRVVNRPEYTGSGLTNVTSRGAEYVPASGVDELGTRMLRELRSATAPALVYGYHPELDKAGHQFGLTSVEWAAAAADVERLIHRLTTGLPPDAALLITADHGQLDIPADRRLDIDEVPGLAAGVRHFAGEPRVRYLHAEPGAAADVLATWRELAGHAAWVGTREETIATGLFGPVEPSFAGRIGDVVVICQEDWAILGRHREHVSVAALVAMHGALTPAETQIPLFVIRKQ
jgi:hypothetical protein